MNKTPKNTPVDTEKNLTLIHLLSKHILPDLAFIVIQYQKEWLDEFEESFCNILALTKMLKKYVKKLSKEYSKKFSELHPDRALGIPALKEQTLELRKQAKLIPKRLGISNNVIRKNIPNEYPIKKFKNTLSTIHHINELIEQFCIQPVYFGDTRMFFHIDELNNVINNLL